MMNRTRRVSGIPSGSSRPGRSRRASGGVWGTSYRGPSSDPERNTTEGGRQLGGEKHLDHPGSRRLQEAERGGRRRDRRDREGGDAGRRGPKGEVVKAVVV